MWRACAGRRAARFLCSGLASFVVFAVPFIASPTVLVERVYVGAREITGRWARVPFERWRAHVAVFLDKFVMGREAAVATGTVAGESRNCSN